MTNFNFRLTHYSNLVGLNVLKPQAGDTLPDGNGAEKKRAADPQFTPRWYAYINDQHPEPRIAARKYKYTTVIDGRRLYDVDKDADGYRDSARNADATYFENALHEAGYNGYFSASYGITALFIPLTCEAIAHEGDLFVPTQEV